MKPALTISAAILIAATIISLTSKHSFCMFEMKAAGLEPSYCYLK